METVNYGQHTQNTIFELKLKSAICERLMTVTVQIYTQVTVEQKISGFAELNDKMTENE